MAGDMTSLADALLRTSALQSGLLSKAASYDAESADGIFSGILSQSCGAESQSAASVAFPFNSGGPALSSDNNSLLSSASGADASCEDTPSELAIKSIGDTIDTIKVLMSIIKKMGNGSLQSSGGDDLGGNGGVSVESESACDASVDANSASGSVGADQLDGNIQNADDAAPSADPAENNNSLEAALVELMAALQSVQRALQNEIASQEGGSEYDALTADCLKNISFIQSSYGDTATENTEELGYGAAITPANKMMREIMDLLKSASAEGDILFDAGWNGTKTQSQFADDVELYLSKQSPLQNAGINNVAEKVYEKLESLMELTNSLKSIANKNDEDGQSGINIVIEDFVQARATAIEEIVTKAAQDMKEALQLLQEVREKVAESATSEKSEDGVNDAITEAKTAMDNAVFALGDRRKTTDKKSKDKDASSDSTDISGYQQARDVADNKSSVVRHVGVSDSVSSEPYGYDEHASGSGLSDLSMNSESAGTSEATGFMGSSATKISFSDTLSENMPALNGAAHHGKAAEQVALQIRRVLKNGNSEISMQLQPEGLGKVTVKLEFGAGGKVHGTLTADNQQTLNMLKQDAVELQKALQEAGLQADSGSLQFNLGEQGSQQNGAGQASHDRQETGNYFGSSFDGEQHALSEDLVEIGTIIEDSYVTPDAVNIRV